MKRFLSLLLVLLSLLLLPGCTELLDALLPEDARDFFGNLYLQDEETEDTDQDTGGDTDTDVYIEETVSLGYYYDQLSEDSRTVYRAIYLDCHNTDGIAIVFRSPLVFHLTADMTDAEVDTLVCSKISDMVQPAMDAMLYDHPEITWISMEQDGGSTFRISSTKQKNQDDSTTLTVKKMYFQLMYAPGYSPSVIAAETEALREAVLAAGLGIEEGASRYTILSALQKHLCATVTYTKGAPHEHEVTGALIDRAAVCDGYAKAFKLLCYAYDIPCVIVSGTATQGDITEAHAWNYVQMEDGNWYAVDVTWDDRGDTADSDYFLVGSHTVTSLTLGTFGDSHHASGKFSGGSYEPFSFPTLSTFRYYIAPILPDGWIPVT